MSMVFQFRMLSDENDRFVRDYDVLYDMTLLEFHNFILQTLEYEDCVTSFFTADNRWEKLREFTLIDMDEPGENAPELMENITLGQVMHKLHDRLIYLFDMFGDRAYYLELMGAYEAEEGAIYPREIYAMEEVPDQYDPSKNVVDEDSIFDNMMEDFQEETEHDDYDGYNGR
ncbi:MAG: hypothetical protein RRZ83_05835 [Alistipes sp.]